MYEAGQLSSTQVAEMEKKGLLTKSTELLEQRQ